MVSVLGKRDSAAESRGESSACQIERQCRATVDPACFTGKARAARQAAATTEAEVRPAIELAIASGEIRARSRPSVRADRSRGGAEQRGASQLAGTAMACKHPDTRVFHADSYGYRPGRSALDAVGVCRERC